MLNVTATVSISIPPDVAPPHEKIRAKTIAESGVAEWSLTRLPDTESLCAESVEVISVDTFPFNTYQWTSEIVPLTANCAVTSPDAEEALTGGLVRATGAQITICLLTGGMGGPAASVMVSATRYVAPAPL